MLKLSDLASRADFETGPLHVSPARRLVEGPGGSANVEPIVMKVLLLLLDADGSVVTRDELLGNAWGDVFVGDDSLNRAIARVRKIASETAPGLIDIQTIPRTGYRLSIATASPKAASIAVLPFVNQSGDADQDYFVEGMVDEIVAALTRIRALLVISSESSWALKGKDWDDQQAAARMGARYILKGSVRRSGSRIRISTQLVDTSHCVQVCSERFDYELKDVFELQDRIALEVAAAIEPGIYEAEVRRAARQPVEDLGCYDLYLRAAPLRATCREEEVIQALELLERALALDPDFAPALAQAAGCHSQIHTNGWGSTTEWHKAQGLALAERAVAKAGEDASVLAQAANAIMDLGGDLPRAIALAERAIAINPGCARAWFISGVAHLQAEEGDIAIEHLRTAARLDPISSLNDVINVHIGIVRMLQGDYTAALSTMAATTHRTARIHLILAALYGYLNMPRECEQEVARCETRSRLSVEEMLETGIPQERSRALLMHGIQLGRSAAGTNGRALKTG
jgi:TolB-like protein